MSIAIMGKLYDFPIKSVHVYTTDIHLELPNKDLEKYGPDIVIEGLYDKDIDFITIHWLRLKKVINKSEIKCIDIIF